MMERFLDDSSVLVRETRFAFEYSLGNLLFKQACFYAERLVAECLCDESLYLLGLGHFHNQDLGRASRCLRGNRLPEARYLHAKCCVGLQRWDEAEDALVSSSSGGTAMASGKGGGGSLDRTDVVNGASGLLLLGLVKEKQAKREQAIECYAKCLEFCPFMWEAYERWSSLVLACPSSSSSKAGSSTASMAPRIFNDQRFADFLSSHQAQQAQSRVPQQRHLAPVPSPCSSSNLDVVAAQPLGAVVAPRPLQQNMAARNSEQIQNKELGHHHNAGGPRKERKTSEHQQHSRIATAVGAGNQSGVPYLGSHVQPSHRGSSSRGSTALASPSIQAEAAQASSSSSGGAIACGQHDTEAEGGEGGTLASLLGNLGGALHLAHSFETSQAIQALSRLSKRHYETGFVLDLVGFCYFESADYKKAEQIYQHVWKLEPRRVEGLEYYSSVLWHLQKDIELGHLAQQCLQWDRLKPQVWCVVGNCYSRQREHDVAIKFFKRAIQVDPSFTYAYTLCAHELVANEKFDKAVPMYEHALSIDPRHYNAWWGLGNIFHRQEEHENARYHFMKALEINKNNSVLRCYVGMVFDALSHPLMALENFDYATKAEPHNGMAYFHKACVLISLERYEEALVDLKKVRSLAPKEAAVHFQLGKVYMKLLNYRKALLHFNIAMELNRDSKEYHAIKTHIERLHNQGVRDADGADDEPPADAAATTVGGSSAASTATARAQNAAATATAARPPGNFIAAGAADTLINAVAATASSSCSSGGGGSYAPSHRHAGAAAGSGSSPRSSEITGGASGNNGPMSQSPSHIAARSSATSGAGRSAAAGGRNAWSNNSGNRTAWM
jgi:anaphase-promoting complex subunit 3